MGLPGSRKFGEGLVSFWAIPRSCGAGSGLVLGASAGFRAGSGRFRKCLTFFIATSTVHVRCASPSSPLDAHTHTHTHTYTYTHCIDSK